MPDVGPAFHTGRTQQCVTRVAADEQLSKFRRADHGADCDESLNKPCIGTRRQIVVRDERPQTMRDEDHRATLATSAIDRIGETLL
jgi:hypothetical protein